MKAQDTQSMWCMPTPGMHSTFGTGSKRYLGWMAPSGSLAFIPLELSHPSGLRTPTVPRAANIYCALSSLLNSILNT